MTKIIKYGEKPLSIELEQLQFLIRSWNISIKIEQVMSQC
jgi:hypothetical protein